MYNMICVVYAKLMLTKPVAGRPNDSIMICYDSVGLPSEKSQVALAPYYYGTLNNADMYYEQGGIRQVRIQPLD